MKLYAGLTIEENIEFKALGKMTIGEISVGQFNRYNELKNKILNAVERNCNEN